MKPIRLAWLVLALATAALAAGFLPAFAADKEITVTGRILKIQPGGRLTLHTVEGKQVELTLDSRSQLRQRGQEVRLGQLKEGTRVRVTYERIDSQNHVLTLRDAPVTAEEISQELREALETTKAYTYQQKAEYQKKLEPVLHDLDDRIEGLREQAKGVRKEAQQRYAEAIEELQRQRKMVREQLAKVQAAAPGVWEEVKSGMSAAWEDLRKAFQRAHDRLKEGSPSDQP